jgi:hypothetical protein
MRGKTGKTGAAGKPGITPEAVEALTSALQTLRDDAAVQFHRIAQLQAQLDVALGELQRLKTQSQPAGRQRRAQLDRAFGKGQSH